jgi:hypothetical protein
MREYSGVVVWYLATAMTRIGALREKSALAGRRPDGVAAAPADDPDGF